MPEDYKCGTCRWFDPREEYCAEWDVWMHKDDKCCNWQECKKRERVFDTGDNDDREDAVNG